MRTEKFTILSDDTTTTNQAEVTFSPRKPLHTVEINIHRETICSKIGTPKIQENVAKPRKRTKGMLSQGAEEQAKIISKCEDAAVTVEDLTGDAPSESYWKKLAESKTKSLNNALEVNRLLTQRIKEMEEEMKIKDEMLEEARSMADVIKELINQTAEENLD